MISLTNVSGSLCPTSFIKVESPGSNQEEGPQGATPREPGGSLLKELRKRRLFPITGSNVGHCLLHGGCPKMKKSYVWG